MWHMTLDTFIAGWCFVGLCVGAIVGLLCGVFVGMRLYWRTGKW
jgi:hypothetical protein